MKLFVQKMTLTLHFVYQIPITWCKNIFFNATFTNKINNTIEQLVIGIEIFGRCLKRCWGKHHQNLAEINLTKTFSIYMVILDVDCTELFNALISFKNVTLELLNVGLCGE